MKAVTLLLSFICVCASSSAQSAHAECNASPEPSPFVVVGDSLSAGVQNFSLLDTQQANGYASVIARQAGWPLTLPLVPFPGAPNVLQLVSLGPPIVIEPAPGSLPSPPTPPRDNPSVQPTNIAVPGLTVSGALSLRPSPTATDPETQWATIVLGFPSLLLGQAPTEVELANCLRPEILIDWLGNNDALVPALTGQLSALTPIYQFAVSYEQVLGTLGKTGAKIVTATIPDVTEVPYFTSVKTIAAQAGLPIGTVTAMLGIGANDFVRPSALTLIDGILTGKTPGPLPTNCPAQLLGDIGLTTIPCVLTASDAATVKATVDSYNFVIEVETYLHGGATVDAHSLVDQIYTHGYKLNDSTTLTAGFLGGLFSLDGIHPSNTGYGVIAASFIETMNGFLGKHIPAPDIQKIFNNDPLRKYVPSTGK